MYEFDKAEIKKKGEGGTRADKGGTDVSKNSISKTTGMLHGGTPERAGRDLREVMSRMGEPDQPMSLTPYNKRLNEGI